jgi:hypothetical protein
MLSPVNELIEEASRGKNLSSFTSEYINIWASKWFEMTKSFNYKLVALDKSYNFRITFMSIWGSYEGNMFFKDLLSREETFVSIICASKWFQMKKVWSKKL